MPQLQGAFSVVNDTGGTFGFPCTYSLKDPGNNSTGSSWTLGAMNVFPIPSRPTMAKGWTVTGWSIQLQGIMEVATPNVPYGKLGKILASLILGAGGLPPVTNAAFAPPAQAALPNLQTVWDGSTDPIFPIVDSANMARLPTSTGYLQQTFQLPQPQQLNPGEQLAVGLWLTPSLLHAVVNITIYNAQYGVTYDA